MPVMPLRSTALRWGRLAQSLTLRVKLTLWILVIASLIHLSLAAVVLVYHRAAINRYFNMRLERAALPLFAGLEADGFEADRSELQALAGDERITEPYLAALYREPEGLVASTAPLTPPLEAVRGWLGRETSVAVRLPSSDVPTTDDESEYTRVLIHRTTDRAGRTHIVLVGVSDVHAERMMRIVSSVLIVTIPAGIAAAAMSGWLFGGALMRPFAHLGELARAMEPDRLDIPMDHRSPVIEIAQLERSLEQARARLRAALVAQERFISNVSHELKTPVSVLLTEAQTVEREGLSEGHARFIDSVTDEMRRLGRMVESFLLLTRVRAGKGVTNIERCELNEVVMQSIESCASMARQHHCMLIPRLESEGAIVEGNNELLRVLIDNLIRNAIRFSPDNGRVVITVSRDALLRFVKVRDQGPGIPSELSSNLFDRFSQGGERVHGRGYGLGLSIAQGIAELHGGMINFSNVAEGGCEFAVTLPATQDAQGRSLSGVTPVAR
jgi:signal transduction histidine kinase